MPHCTKCGATVAEGAAFCPSCGASQGAGPAQAGTQPGLAENVAGMLCYAVGWITGIIFFLTDKRPSVRFHAAQSIVVFGGLNILSWILGWMFGIGFLMGGWGAFSLGWALLRLVHLAAIVLWILLMIKAYQGERFRVPFAADLADSLAAKSI